jgi:quercetin dioxygenase-like cupin family protein
MKCRRVVTGYDAGGKAAVTSDQIVQDVTIPNGMKATPMWAFDGKPSFTAPNVVENGIPPNYNPDALTLFFGVAELAAGVAFPMHGTKTVDMIFVTEGEVTCRLDSGVAVTLRKNDMLVQRGTVHGWENRTNARCAWIWTNAGNLES